MLEGGVVKHLPREVCEQHAPCEELRSECKRLREKWEALKRKVEDTLASLITQVWLSLNPSLSLSISPFNPFPLYSQF